MEEGLFNAARAGDTEYLRRNRDPRILSKLNLQGDTACHVALRGGHLQFALEIASLHHPVLYMPNTDGDTVLHCALKIGQPEFFVQAVNLIRKYLGKSIKYTDELPSKVLNPLMLEARRCYISSWDGEGKSLVHLAAEKGYFEAVKILLQTPALNGIDAPRRRTGDDLSGVCHLVLMRVMSRAWEKVMKTPAPELTRRSTALHAAVRNEHYGIVHLLMLRNRSLISVEDEEGRSPVFIAVDLKLVKMCNLLLEEYRSFALMWIITGGVNHLSACQLAARNDDCLEILQLFMERFPRWCYEKNADGQNVLHIAVKAGALGIIKCIMKHKKLRRMIINEQDNDGNTPLSLATASNGNEEMLNALLASPVNVPPLKDEVENVQQTGIENYHSNLLVMVTLITTVTFAAAIALPGGYKSDDPNEGTATLVGSKAFIVFLVFDTTSFLASIISMALLIAFAGDSDNQMLHGDFLKVAVRMASWSLIFMLVAFGAGVWAVIGSECKWLAILITVMTSVVTLAINPIRAAWMGWTN